LIEKLKKLLILKGQPVTVLKTKEAAIFSERKKTGK
jgi:hypothetical protein